MKFREHRETLKDSLATEREIPNLAELQKVCEEIAGTAGKIAVKYYCHDDRIGEDVYIVLMTGFGVVGFTNKSVRDLK